MGYYEGELGSLGYNNNGFGNSWEGLIGLALVASLFGGGWGNGGFGGYGRGAGFGGGYGEALGYELGKVATTNDVASGFNNSAVLGSLNDIKLTQASNLNFINQGFSGLNTQIQAGFAGVDNAICTLGYQNQAGFNSLAHQISDCLKKLFKAIKSKFTKVNTVGSLS